MRTLSNVLIQCITLLGLCMVPPLATAQAANVAHYDVAADGNILHLLVGTGKKGTANIALWYRQSSDGGASWSTPVRVNQDGDRLSAHHPGENPQIVATGKRVLAVWSEPRVGGGRGALVRTQLSEDGGATWKAGGIPFNVVGGSQILMELAARDGKMHMVWLDSRDGKQALRYASSADGGASWGDAVLVAARTCDCCWNSLAVGASGRVSALFRGAAPRDMMLASLTDGKWSAPQPAGDFKWDFDGCPHVGGALVDTGNARHALVWTGSAKSGLYHVAIRDSRDGTGGETPTRMGSDDARDADLAANADGSLVAVWDESRRDSSQIYLARSRDGITWSKAEAVSGAKSESSFPRVITNGKAETLFWLGGSLRSGASLFVNGKPLSF